MRGASFEDVLPRVAEIVADVRERGDEALLDWTERFDGERPELRVPADQLRAARLQPDEVAALRGLAAAVAAFCEPQRPPDVALEAVDGVHSERRWVPLASVGVYVPGGRATYPSSLVMAAVPARVAGVERIAIVTPRPPRRHSPPPTPWESTRSTRSGVPRQWRRSPSARRRSRGWTRSSAPETSG